MGRGLVVLLAAVLGLESFGTCNCSLGVGTTCR
ncbi:hypothetical protein GLYMA_02G028666v4 [Glycine max]|nr:hypothetical protein GLYMA_02G028666v4 [Glycine max]